MDALDVKILRLLMMGGGSFVGSDVRRPYRLIASKLQVTEDTVRNRVEKFREDGFVRGWKLGINPTLFGRRASFLTLDVRPPSSIEDALQKISLIDGVLFIVCYFGGHLGVHLTYESERSFEKTKELVARICNSENLLSMKLSFPACAMKLTKTDWNLLKALQGNTRKPIGVLAREAGVSPKTAKRRIENLLGDGALYTLPDINARALRGGVASSLLVLYDEKGIARQVASKIIAQFDESLLLFHVADPEYGWFAFVQPNISKTKEVDRWVRDLQGVRSTSLRLVEDFVNLATEAFRGELDKKIAVGIPQIQSK